MEIGLIAPIAHLDTLAIKSNYHLVLAHIYRESAEYRKFYKAMVDRGDTVILDNAAYELGESISDELLYMFAVELRPTHMILPDVRFNREATVKRGKEAYGYFKSKGYSWKLLAVPQGNCGSEILRCYNEFVDLSWVDGFGLYEEIGEVAMGVARHEYLRGFEAHKHFDSNRFYHLLGMEEAVEEVQELAKFPWVNGVDSCKPIVYGMNDIPITREGAHGEYPHRPKGYFTMSATNNPEYNWKLAARNCDEMLSWVGDKGVQH